MVYHTDMSKVLFLVVGRGRNDDDPVYLNTLHKAINESAAGKIYLLTTADGRRYAEKIKDGYASSKCVEIKDFDEENMEFDADKINKPYIHRDCKITINLISCLLCKRDMSTGVLKFCDEFFIKER